jgi:hypothetical protein
MEDSLIEVRKQTGYARDAADAAQKGLLLARENFRDDERPYVALVPGVAGKLELVSSGPHAGHLRMEGQLSNYGKSPAIESKRDAHFAIGKEAASEVRWRPAPLTYYRILSAGDKTAFEAYSDRIVTMEEFNALISGAVPAIIYGHVEYGDVFGDPSRVYESSFCAGIVASKPGEIEAACQLQNYMKRIK